MGNSKQVLTAEQRRKLYDLQLRHQVYLQRVGATYAAEIWKLVDASNSEVYDYLRKRLSKFGAAAPDRATEAKFKEIEHKVAGIRNAAFDEAQDYLKKSAMSIGEAEVTFVAASLAPAFAMGEVVNGISKQTLSNLSNYGTFSGKTIEGWFKDLVHSDLTRIMGQVRSGVVNGKTTDDIVNALQGMHRADYSDGLLFTSSRDAAAIVRTATNGMANSARMAFYEQNEDVIDCIQYVATLDNRTCAICRALDGKQWQVGDSDIPQMPLHPNSRSVLMAVAKGFGLLGQRPAKGEDGQVKQVPATTTYPEWFSRQDASFQKDVLGMSRYALYKKGDLPLEKFVDFGNNRPFTLEQLRRKDSEAFEAAGLSAN